MRTRHGDDRCRDSAANRIYDGAMIRAVAIAVLAFVLLSAGPWAAGRGRAAGLTFRITETPQVSQPGPFSGGGARTVVVPRTRIEVDEGNGRPPVVTPAAPAAPAPRESSAAPVAPKTHEITGKVKAIDGDTLEVGGVRLRLYGIAAPPKDATCGAGAASWPCGREAAFALAFETAEHWVSCTWGGPPAKDSRATAPAIPAAVCLVGPYDLAALMVRKGWELAEPGAAPGYAGEESEARLAGRGIWRGHFVPPEAWRRRHTPGSP